MQMTKTIENLRMIESSGAPQEQIVRRVSGASSSPFRQWQTIDRRTSCLAMRNVIQISCLVRTVAAVTPAKDSS